MYQLVKRVSVFKAKQKPLKKKCMNLVKKLFEKL